jgi:hypothetical protein
LQSFIDFNSAVQAILAVSVLDKTTNPANNAFYRQTNLVRDRKYGFQPVVDLKFRITFWTFGVTGFRFYTMAPAEWAPYVFVAYNHFEWFLLYMKIRNYIKIR